jgi:hypothetical protein
MLGVGADNRVAGQATGNAEIYPAEGSEINLEELR